MHNWLNRLERRLYKYNIPPIMRYIVFAMGGVFHQDTNPTGEVLHPGYLYEVKNIPDFNKISDTRVELVGIIKI